MNPGARIAIGLIGRAVFWVGLWAIVLQAAVAAYALHDYVMMVAAVGMFPITFIAYPCLTGSYWLLCSALAGYWTSTFIGGMEPVD